MTQRSTYLSYALKQAYDAYAAKRTLKQSPRRTPLQVLHQVQASELLGKLQKTSPSICHYADAEKRIDNMLHPRAYDSFESVLDILHMLQNDPMPFPRWYAEAVFRDYADLYEVKYGVNINELAEVA